MGVAVGAATVGSGVGVLIASGVDVGRAAIGSDGMGVGWRDRTDAVQPAKAHSVLAMMARVSHGK
jgi:hypothetical protein